MTMPPNKIGNPAASRARKAGFFPRYANVGPATAIAAPVTTQPTADLASRSLWRGVFTLRMIGTPRLGKNHVLSVSCPPWTRSLFPWHPGSGPKELLTTAIKPALACSRPKNARRWTVPIWTW
jgi:hypothetical protein